MICLDELGPIGARCYPGPRWSSDAHRPHFRPDYARHGYRWAFGALAHRTGAVYVQTASTRDTAAWLHFLDGLEAFAPPGDAYLIVDNLPLHWSVNSMPWNWGHPRFHFVSLPKGAAWLNLIEGFWKILRQRALAGRACASTDALTAPYTPVSAIGIGSRRPSSGDVRPSPSASSSASMSTGFEERRT